MSGSACIERADDLSKQFVRGIIAISLCRSPGSLSAIHGTRRFGRSRWRTDPYGSLHRNINAGRRRRNHQNRGARVPRRRHAGYIVTSRVMKEPRSASRNKLEPGEPSVRCRSPPGIDQGHLSSMASRQERFVLPRHRKAGDVYAQLDQCSRQVARLWVPASCGTAVSRRA